MTSRRAGVRRGRAAHTCPRHATSPTGSCCCRSRSGARSPRSTPSRAGSTTSQTATSPTEEKRRAARGAPRRGSRADPGDDPMLVALADARRDTRSRGTRSTTSSRADSRTSTRRATRRSTSSRLLPARRRRGRRRLVGVYGADAAERAETLGIALQLINIMRDVREDWQLGRVYLPQDELAVIRRSRRTTSRAVGCTPAGTR